ncbi:MAG: ZIP family metal transporter [Bacteroidales bacterium]|nr:ZIP family metal transporter [Bacteroidales bacterium]
MDKKLIIEILLFSLIPVATMFLGSVWGANFNVGSKMRSSILHFAAGVIFAVVAVELLPIVVANGNILGISIGFFAGLALMSIIKIFSHKAEQKHKKEQQNNKTGVLATKLLPMGLLVGIAVDISLDGILMGVGFAAGDSEGLLLCIALSLEILVLGLVIATELKSEKFTKKRIVIITSVVSFLFVFGAFIGSILLSFMSENALNIILAFGLSALMYLVTEELLVEAHENEDTTLSTAIFFIGFFIFMMIAIIT